MSITQPPRQAHLDKLRTELERLERARQNLRLALSQYNDIEAQKHFAPVIDLLGVILENEKQGIAHFLASDLENIASALRRFDLPDDDPVLEAETPSLAAMIAARGRVSDRLAGCLQELKHLRFPVLDVDAPYAPVPRNVLGEALIRLDERLRITEESVDALRVEAREADAAGAPVSQSGLINFHVSSLKVEVSAARFEASIAELVDMAALARAAEIIRDIGKDLAAFGSATYSRLVAAVAAAGRSTARLAGRAAKGIRTVIGLARRKVAGRRKLPQAQAALEVETEAPEAPASLDNAALRDEFWRLIEVGDEAVRLGGLDNAKGAYERAKAIAEGALEQHPDELNWQRNLSVSYNKIGDVYLNLGDFAEAKKNFEHGLVIRKSLSERMPNNLEILRDLSVSHEKIGDALAPIRDTSGALKSYESSLSIRRSLSIIDSINTRWRHDVCVSLLKIGLCYEIEYIYLIAIEKYSEALTFVDPLFQKDPSNIEWMRTRSNVQERIGRVHQQQGNFTDALRFFEFCLAARQTIIQRDPTNTEWQRDLSVSYYNIGTVLYSMGNRADSLHHLEEALAIREHLHERDPTNAMWRNDVNLGRAAVAKVKAEIAKKA